MGAIHNQHAGERSTPEDVARIARAQRHAPNFVDYLAQLARAPLNTFDEFVMHGARLRQYYATFSNSTAGDATERAQAAALREATALWQAVLRSREQAMARAQEPVQGPGQDKKGRRGGDGGKGKGRAK